jgi:ABC-2 type transport system permease protein
MKLAKTLAFLKRDYRIEVSYRFSFLLRFFGIFFSVATFFFIAKLFGRSVSPYLTGYGGDYFAFVLIGIAFAGFLGTGLNSFAASISSAQAQGTLEAMLVTPTKLSTIVISSSLWNFLLTSFNVLIYLIFGTIVFGADLSHANLVAALLILLLTIIVFSALGIVSASFIIIFKRGDPINRLFGSASSLMGGTYFPITVLPLWLQKFSYLFPLFYALRAMRYAVLQGYSLAALLPDILALSGLALGLTPVGLLAFRYAVRQAKIDGSLGTY